MPHNPPRPLLVGTSAGCRRSLARTRLARWTQGSFLFVTATALLASSLVWGGVASASEIVHPSVVSEDASDITPQLVDDGAFPRGPRVLAITSTGDRMFAGGEFHQVRGGPRSPVLDRANLVAFDAVSGEISDAAPELDGAVWAVEASGDSVYVGGSFRNVDGVPYPGLVKIDADTGAVDPTFKPRRATVGTRQLELVDGRLFVGGSFGRRLLALDPVTGADTNYVKTVIGGKIENSAGATSVFSFSINPAGTRLVAVGNFTTIDGASRPRAFMLDLGSTGATLAEWYYEPLADKCASNTPVRQAYLNDVDFSPSGDWFVLAASGFVPARQSQIGTHVCDAAARFETSVAHPTRPTWINYTGGDTLTSAVVTGAAVYVQGHQRWLDNPLGYDTAGPGAVVRKGIGAIDPVTGRALDWDPVKQSGIGGFGFHVTPGGLWIGSESKRFGGEPHWGIAFAPLPS